MDPTLYILNVTLGAELKMLKNLHSFHTIITSCVSDRCNSFDIVSVCVCLSISPNGTTYRPVSVSWILARRSRGEYLGQVNILSPATFPGAPSYGGVRTWVEGSQAHGNCPLAEASNLLGYKEYAQQDFITD